MKGGRGRRREPAEKSMSNRTSHQNSGKKKGLKMNTVAFVEKKVLLEKHGVFILRGHILWGWGFFIWWEGGSCGKHIGRTSINTHFVSECFWFVFLIGFISNVFKQFHTWIGCL